MKSIRTLPRPRPPAPALALAGLLASLPIVPVLVAAMQPPAHRPGRGPLVVTHCGDDGAGSLREAYSAAIDGDEIDLGQLTCGTITLTSGALVDDASASYVRITGPSSLSGRTLTISGNHASRVFVHNGDEALVLRNLSIEAGRHLDGHGGCVYSRGGVFADTTTFFDCSVSGNEVHGGAIFSEGDVQLRTSSISGCSASGTSAASGGGIHAQGSVILYAAGLQANIAIAANGPVRTGEGGGVFAAGSALIAFSTLTGNHAVVGGGVRAYGLSLYDSTLSGNLAELFGGGLAQVGGTPLVISNSTIAFNRSDAGEGAGAYLDGAATIDSTLIAGNTRGFPGTASDLAGAPGSSVAGANNLVQATALVVPPDTISADPLLDPLLQDNGGLTSTHALLPDSPAIDRGGNPHGLCCDQRLRSPGSDLPFEREVGAAADIGAYESGAPDRILTDGFDPAIESRGVHASTQ